MTNRGEEKELVQDFFHSLCNDCIKQLKQCGLTYCYTKDQCDYIADKCTSEIFIKELDGIFTITSNNRK